MEDIVVFAFLGACFAMAIAYAFGAWANPFWKCKQLRGFLKKNYVIICLLSKDRRSFVVSVVNAVKDKIKYRDFIWYITEGSIWRALEIPTEKNKEPADSTRLVGNEPKKKFFMDMLQHAEGVPIVFLDMDTLTPVGFQNAEAKVKANEISAFLQADWLNEYAKMQASNKSLQIWLIAACCLSLLSVGLTYILTGGLDDKMTAISGQVSQISAINNKLDLLIAKAGVIPSGSTIKNGSIVIPVGG